MPIRFPLLLRSGSVQIGSANVHSTDCGQQQTYAYITFIFTFCQFLFLFLYIGLLSIGLAVCKREVPKTVQTK